MEVFHDFAPCTGMLTETSPHCLVLYDSQCTNNSTYWYITWAIEVVISYTYIRKSIFLCIYFPFYLFLFGGISETFLDSRFGPVIFHTFFLQFISFRRLCVKEIWYSVFVHSIRMFPFHLAALHVVTYVSDSKIFFVACSLCNLSNIRGPTHVLHLCYISVPVLLPRISSSNSFHLKIFWEHTTCSLVEVHRCFGGYYYLCLQGPRPSTRMNQEPESRGRIVFSPWRRMHYITR